MPLLRNVWRSGSGWERRADAWLTSGPSMEGAGSTSIYLGAVAGSTKGLVAPPGASAESLAIRVAFIDPSIGVHLLKWYQQRTATR